MVDFDSLIGGHSAYNVSAAKATLHALVQAGYRIIVNGGHNIKHPEKTFLYCPRNARHRHTDMGGYVQPAG